MILDPDPKSSVHIVNPSSQRCNHIKALPCSCHRSSQLAPSSCSMCRTTWLDNSSMHVTVVPWYCGTVAPWYCGIVEAPHSATVPCSFASRWSVYRLSLLNNFQSCHQFLSYQSIQTNSDISPCSETVPHLFASRCLSALLRIPRIPRFPRVEKFGIMSPIPLPINYMCHARTMCP